MSGSKKLIKKPVNPAKFVVSDPFEDDGDKVISVELHLDPLVIDFRNTKLTENNLKNAKLLLISKAQDYIRTAQVFTEKEFMNEYASRPRKFDS